MLWAVILLFSLIGPIECALKNQIKKLGLTNILQGLFLPRKEYVGFYKNYMYIYELKLIFKYLLNVSKNGHRVDFNSIPFPTYFSL